ncbi:hypothetical protein F511_22878 [Dorcoceras hygrometricum]|uniref:Uncharacterized protein n=1 Tax=Dorcoceras hygrometricum TaxID=472368 RepID=A0A2Z7AQU4_9LAMI|nr:hypothetical protein F511_22878 [Dorcoceras hygrometricum]
MPDGGARCASSVRRLQCGRDRNKSDHTINGGGGTAGEAAAPALEGLMNLARTESPRYADRNKSDHTINGGGGTAARWWRRRP